MPSIFYSQVRKLLTLGFASTTLLFGCRGPQKTVEELAPATTVSSELTSQKNSEARMAPDEIFFAGQYLKLIAQYSHKDSLPNWSEASLKSREDGAVFDFTANFNPDRLELMTQVILQASDSDGDGLLSESEFLSFRWDPQATGALGTSQSWNYGKEVYQKIAAGEAGVTATQLRQWLVAMGPLLKHDLDLQGEHSYRLALVRAWEAVLAGHDLNHDGRLDSAEQKLLTQERSKTLLKLTRE